MVYRMIFNQTAYFGRGAIKEIPGVAKSHGFTKAFIVTDPVLLETGTVKKVTDVLDEAGMSYEVFDNVKPNPPVECIQDGVAKFAASGADFLIGLMVVSEAVPAVVGTPKIGTDGFLVSATPSRESTSENSGLAVMMPMPLQVSCGEPPPKPIRKSAPDAANLATPYIMSRCR